jgi:hypothetical protein
MWISRYDLDRIEADAAAGRQLREITKDLIERVKVLEKKMKQWGEIEGKTIYTAWEDEDYRPSTIIIKFTDGSALRLEATNEGYIEAYLDEE